MRGYRPWIRSISAIRKSWRVTKMREESEFEGIIKSLFDEEQYLTKEGKEAVIAKLKNRFIENGPVGTAPFSCSSLSIKMIPSTIKPKTRIRKNQRQFKLPLFKKKIKVPCRLFVSYRNSRLLRLEFQLSKDKCFNRG